MMMQFFYKKDLILSSIPTKNQAVIFRNDNFIKNSKKKHIDTPFLRTSAWPKVGVPQHMWYQKSSLVFN